MKAIIVVHGTSQDSMSHNENTVKLARAARALGYFVIDIGGPASTERTLKNLLAMDTMNSSSTVDDALGWTALYGIDMMRGIVLGHGVDEIVRDVKDAILACFRLNASSIDIVGFSRGAVAVALGVERIGRELGPNLISPIPINITLLDPVPGPLRIQQSVELPSFVNSVHHLVSKHEGRPGFHHLGLKIPKSVSYRGDLVMGVHGDIGGSTGSGVSRMALSRVAQSVGVGSLVLTPDEMFQITIGAMSGHDSYSNQGVMQFMDRRGLGWSPVDHDPRALILPSFESQFDLIGRHDREWERALERLAIERYRRQLRESERRRQQQAREQAERELIQSLAGMTISIPGRPVPSQSGTVVFPPSSPTTLTRFVPKSVIRKIAGGVINVITRGRGPKF